MKREGREKELGVWPPVYNSQHISMHTYIWFLIFETEDGIFVHRQQVIRICLCYRWRSDAKKQQEIKNPTLFNGLRSAVLLAEHAMLYALGFQFYIYHPYYTVLEVVCKLAKHPDRKVAKFWEVMRGKEELQVWISSCHTISINSREWIYSEVIPFKQWWLKHINSHVRITLLCYECCNAADLVWYWSIEEEIPSL